MAKAIISQEAFALNACYNLARQILDEHKNKGFIHRKEEDMAQARKVNSLGQVLIQYDDTRGYELSIEADSMIRFPDNLRRVK